MYLRDLTPYKPLTIKRQLHQNLIEVLTDFPAVALLGPRQAGKTTLALELADTKLGTVYLDLESPGDQQKLTNPEAYLLQHEHSLVILDEVQHMPLLFQTLRSLIDKGRRKGLRTSRFLLLGSASGEVLRQTSESLAGRIAYLELPPFQVSETRLDQQDRLWLRGGFPDSFLAASEPKSIQWRQNLINTYLQRDMPAYGARLPAETLRRLWIMLAHRQGALLDTSLFA